MNESKITSNNIEDDEITLKELIFKIKEYAIEIRRNWWVLMLFIVPITAYMFYDAYATKKKYKAELSFMMSDDNGSSLGLSAALGSLGGLIGGGKSQLDKVIELSKSRRILQMALFDSVNIDGKVDLYANHLIVAQEVHKNWQSDTTGLKDFFFKKNDVDKFDRTDNKAFLYLQELLVGKKSIYSASFDKKSEIIRLTLSSNEEILSIELLKAIFLDLKSYYILKSIEKETNTYKVFRSKADSVKNLARAKDVVADRYEDMNRGSLFLEDKREVDRMKKEVFIYNTVYGELEKNANVANLALASKTPTMQEIDLPLAPIKPEKKSKLMSLIIGFTIGGFLGVITVIFRKIIRDALV